MRFINAIIISASALAALVSAANIQFTDAPHGSAEAGKTYTLKYTGDEDKPATILLRKGPSNALVTVDTITTSATGGSFQWTVPKDLAPGGDYALQITSGTDTNYWQIGAIAGGVAPTSTDTSSASSALSSASSKISSISSKLSSATSSASAGTTTPTSSRNSTSVSKPTLTSTTSSGSSSTSGSSTTSSGGAAPSDSNGGAANLKSNAALVLGAVAAIAYLG